MRIFVSNKTTKTNIMTTQQQINLVCGATEAQLKGIKNMQNAQKAYMEFVQNNPSLDIKIYESPERHVELPSRDTSAVNR